MARMSLRRLPFPVIRVVIRLFLTAAVASPSEASAGTLPETVSQRISEEAEAFTSQARRLIGRERLLQKALRPESRARFRIGTAALRRPERHWENREIVSEYGFSLFGQDPGVLHELRQVTTIDGKDLRAGEAARMRLLRVALSQDDQLKQRMLTEFERHGLVGAVCDFGQIILLFSRAGLSHFSFGDGEERWMGAERARVFPFQQVTGDQAVTVFQRDGRQRIPLEGTLWVRAADGMPLRITVRIDRSQENRSIRDEASVEYVSAEQGGLLPTSVVHRQLVDGLVNIENHFGYSNFRRFGAETKIDFGESSTAGSLPK